MEYKKNTWKSRERITKEKLNNIETGIENLYSNSIDKTFVRNEIMNSLVVSNNNSFFYGKSYEYGLDYLYKEKLNGYVASTYDRLPNAFTTTTITYLDASNHVGFTIDLPVPTSKSLDIDGFDIHAKYQNNKFAVTYKGLDGSGSNWKLWGVLAASDDMVNKEISVSLLIRTIETQMYRTPYFINATTTTYLDASSNIGFTIDLGIPSSVPLNLNNFVIYVKDDGNILSPSYKGLDGSESNWKLWGVLEGSSSEKEITVSVTILNYGEEISIKDALNKLFSMMTSYHTISSATISSSLLDSTGAYVVDDFSGDSLDMSKWKYELGYVRNNETQKYTSTNTVINDSVLALRGLKDSDGNWTSASIISHGNFSFLYGRLEAKVRVCNYAGSFPAFWTLGDGFEFKYNEGSSPECIGDWWAWCGEFDIMEYNKGEFTTGIFVNENEQWGRIRTSAYDTSEWHTFAMDWSTDGSLKFYYDGNLVTQTGATDNRAMHTPHYILLNQAIGAAGGTPDDGCNEITTYVDYVKYYPLSTENLKLYSESFDLYATEFDGSRCAVRTNWHDNCINKALNWSSDNTSVIEVHSGYCSAKSESGQATITATSKSGVSRSITLNVNNWAISIS